MGTGFRRISEQCRQKLNLGGADFIPTANERNFLMLKEASEFAAHLRRCEQDIAALKEAVEAIINTSKIVLSAPLPRVYEEAGNGRAQPMVQNNAPPGLIGGNFEAEELSRVSKETSTKVDAEVLTPMQRWLTAYHTVESRMKKLEMLRLEVDSRRRTVSQLGQKVEKQRARLPQTRAKGEVEIETTIKTLQHKEHKLTVARGTFKEHEYIVYTQLQQLIRDSMWLKSYLVSVMRLNRDALSASYEAIGPVDGQGVMQGMSMAHPNAGAVSAGADSMDGGGYLPEKSAGSKQGNDGMGAIVDQGYGGFDGPPVPTHRYQTAAPPQPAYAVDRYSTQQQQPQMAWGS